MTKAEERARGLELLAKVKERLVTLGVDGREVGEGSLAARRLLGYPTTPLEDSVIVYEAQVAWMAEQAKELAVDLAVALQLVRGVP